MTRSLSGPREHCKEAGGGWEGRLGGPAVCAKDHLSSLSSLGLLTHRGFLGAF